MFDGSDSSTVLRRLRTHGLQELTELFENNRSGLRAIVQGRIRGKLAARFDASDIVQESYIRATNQLAKYLESPEIHPVVWLRIICRQLLSEAVRKNMRGRRSPALEVSCGEQYIAESISDSLESVGAIMAREELYAKVSDAVTRLNDTERTILEMRHREDMTFPEIAEALEMKMETAKKRYYRALAKIQKTFQVLGV